MGGCYRISAETSTFLGPPDVPMGSTLRSVRVLICEIVTFMPHLKRESLIRSWHHLHQPLIQCITQLSGEVLFAALLLACHCVLALAGRVVRATLSRS